MEGLWPEGEGAWPEDGNTSNGTTSCEIYHTHKYKMVAVIAASTGTFSVLASLTVISVIAVFKKYNVFIQRLILYLCLAAALNSLCITLRFARLAPDTSDWHRLCVATAFIDQTTLWSLTIAFSCLTFSMLITVVFNKDTKALEFGYIFLIFIFPLAFNWIPFLQESYGEAGAWCWIRTKNYDHDCSVHKLGMYLKYALWYAPHYVVLGVLFVVYLVVVTNVIRKRNHWRWLYSSEPAVRAEQLKMKELVMPIIFYPLGFFLLNLVPLINRVYDSINGPNYILWVLHASLSPLQGGYIALVYVLDRDTMRRLNLKELRAYLFHRRTPVEEYPATRGFTDSYDAKTMSPDGSVSSTEGVKVALNISKKGKNSYGSTDDTKTSTYTVESEKV